MIVFVPYNEIFKICKYNILNNPLEVSQGYIPCFHPEAKKAFCSAADCPAKKRLQEKASVEEEN